MADGHLSHDEFFKQLVALFDARHSKDHGTIYLTQKRRESRSSDADADALADLTTPTQPLPILIRAHDAISKPSKKFPSKPASVKKTKMSTVVDAAELDVFFARYADVCRNGMSGLKKRDRKKAKAKKGKGGKGAAAAATS